MNFKQVPFDRTQRGTDDLGADYVYLTVFFKRHMSQNVWLYKVVGLCYFVKVTEMTRTIFNADKDEDGGIAIGIAGESDNDDDDGRWLRR